jgi:hypothetical protein
MEQLSLWDEDVLPKEKYVYFIQEGDYGPIKIGYSEDPLARLSQCQTGNPRKLILLKTLKGGRVLEKKLHKKYAQYNICGEWFSPAIPILKLIEKIAGDRLVSTNKDLQKDLQNLQGSDELVCFYEELFEEDPDGRVSNKDLWLAYYNYCDFNPKISKAYFYRILASSSLFGQAKRSKNTRYRKGIKFKSAAKIKYEKKFGEVQW